MALQRLKSINPAANIDSTLLDATSSYIFAIIAANQSIQKEARVSMWVEPFEYLPINIGEEESKRAYIIKDGILPPGGTFESWRVSANVGDVIKVKSNNGKVSFSLEAVVQSQTTS